MGWKGTLRSLQAAQRRAERESRRRQRELERQRKEMARTEALTQAQYEVEAYENYIEVLSSVHVDCGDPWDWEAIKNAPEPEPPVRSDRHERDAQAELESYEPTLIEKLLRKVNQRRAELSAAVEKAKEMDELEYRKRQTEYERAREEWESNREIAGGILAGDVNAYIEAIRQIAPFSELGELGSSVSFVAEDPRLIEVSIRVNDHEVVPRERKRLLKSGKLSVTDMPKTHFWALYQDYICGCVLRVARELFALLPVDMVIATALGEILNTQTGHMEEQPILSAAMPRETLSRLNFEALDPSDSMDNFVYNMHFRKTKGFAPVEPIKPASLEG